MPFISLPNGPAPPEPIGIKQFGGKPSVKEARPFVIPCWEGIGIVLIYGAIAETPHIVPILVGIPVSCIDFDSLWRKRDERACSNK